MDIGARLKQLRVQNNLTLEELANRSELTKGFLSQVERDLTSPSIDTLSDILEALGTSLSAFFANEVDRRFVFSQEDYFVKEDDHQTIHWIVPNAQKNDMEPILLTLEPMQTSMIMEPYTGETFGYVLQGKVKLIYGEREAILKKGDTFYFKANKSHHIVNLVDKQSKLLWVSTPPSF